MTILYITHTTNMTDGSTKSFINMLIGVRKSGIVPVVICPDKGLLYKYLEQQNIVVYSIKYKALYSLMDGSLKSIIQFFRAITIYSLYNFCAIIQLLNIIKEFKPSLIHTNTSVINIGYIASRIKKIKHVWHIREYQDLDFNIKTIPSKKFFAKRLNKENGNSICITKDIRNNFNLKTENSTVIYNPIADRKAITFDPYKEDYILFVGRLEESKGALDVIKTFLSIAKDINPNIELWIVGRATNANYISIIKKILDEFDLNHQVKIKGEIFEVDKLMQKAKAIIVASRFEGFGRVTAEAMFNGCLVIGKNRGGTKEQFDNGVEITGSEIGLRYNTDIELATHLISISNNSQDYYYSMIQQAATTVENLYTTEENSKRIADYYKSIN